MNISIKYVLFILVYKIFHQNEDELSLDVTGRQVVFRIETALNY